MKLKCEYFNQRKVFNSPALDVMNAWRAFNKRRDEAVTSCLSADANAKQANI